MDRMTNLRQVRVFDAATKTVAEIPLSELSENVIRVRMAGIDGEVYMDPAALALSPPNRPRGDFVDVESTIEEIRNTFAEHIPDTLEGWIDKFRGDMHPEKEIVVWLMMAQCYRATVDGKGLDKAARKEVFDLLVRFSMGGTEEEILAQIKVPRLGRELAVRLMDMWREGPQGVCWGMVG